jgi:hypothetical protein
MRGQQNTQASELFGRSFDVRANRERPLFHPCALLLPSQVEANRRNLQAQGCPAPFGRGDGDPDEYSWRSSV